MQYNVNGHFLISYITAVGPYIFSILLALQLFGCSLEGSKEQVLCAGDKLKPSKDLAFKIRGWKHAVISLESCV